jgi:4-hydroxybenzoate polyprenyltransferase
VVQFLSNLFKTIRPKQTLKNLAILAPLVFSGYLFDLVKLVLALQALIIFTILTASVYIFNDIIDLSNDQRHPYKKNRPIASGRFPIPIAIFTSLTGFFSALILAYQLSFFFFLTLLTYLGLQILYSLWLKKLAVIDILIIASGFVLRVYAGAFAIEVHMSVWFLLCVISLALFLAAGKRRSELRILSEASSKKTRESLSVYSPELLDAYLSMFASAGWLAYALFSFFFPVPLIASKFSFLADLPLTIAGINKLMMLTIPVVIFGIMRYLRIIYEGARAESPESVLLSDKPLLATAGAWGLLVVGIIYGIGG